MASGYILGECPVCKCHVYEDEVSDIAVLRYEKFIHIGLCQQKYEIERNRRKELAELRKLVKQAILN